MQLKVYPNGVLRNQKKRHGSRSDGRLENISKDKELGSSGAWAESKETIDQRKEESRGKHNQEPQPKVQLGLHTTQQDNKTNQRA